MKIYHDVNSKYADYNTIPVDMVENIFDKSRKLGFQIKPIELNNVIGGIRKKSLVVVGAEPGMGKSLISLNIMYELARQSVDVCYIDLENGTEDFVDKIHTRWYGGEKNKKTYQREISDIQNIHYYSPIMFENLLGKKNKADLIKEIIINEYKKSMCEVFIIDPLQALENELDSGKVNNEQGIIIRTLRNLTIELDICIIINHHLRKSGGYRNFTSGEDDLKEEKEMYRIPTLEDLKGSSKISDYATDVWLFYRQNFSKDDFKKGIISFYSRKSRAGFVGKCKLYILKDSLTLKSLKEVYDTSSMEHVYGHI